MDYAVEINAINKFENKVFNLIHDAHNGWFDSLKSASAYHLQAVCESLGVDYKDSRRKKQLIKLIQAAL